MAHSHADVLRSRDASLDEAADLARAGFACMFSTSDEYETALISRRRAEGRYTGAGLSGWSMLMFAGCTILTAGVGLVISALAH